MIYTSQFLGVRNAVRVTPSETRQPQHTPFVSLRIAATTLFDTAADTLEDGHPAPNRGIGLPYPLADDEYWWTCLVR
jgi:hypothetical protein